MSSRKSDSIRLHCTVPGCRVSVGRKADMLRHQEEKHGEMKFCSEPGCDYEGTRRSSRLKAHMEKKHPGSLRAELVVPENKPSGSRYSDQEIDQGEGTYQDQTEYNPSEAQAGYQYPASPTQPTSSTAAGAWGYTAHTSTIHDSSAAQTTQWSSTPQYQTQYQTSYEAQYQAQDSQTWPATYYTDIAYSTDATYQISTPTDSNTYDVSSGYIGDNTSPQNFAEEGRDEEPRYRY